jgi:hypothetical protein
MRKLAVVVVCIGLLAACGSTQSAPAPEVTKTVTVVEPAPVVPEPAPVSSDTDEMIAMIRAAEPMFETINDSEIISVAYQFCEALQSGVSFEQIAGIAEDTIGVDATAALGAGAILYLCPDQEYKLG